MPSMVVDRATKRYEGRLETMATTVAGEFASAWGARDRCAAEGNVEWRDHWQGVMDSILRRLPSGAGFDAGTSWDEERSTADYLRFTTSLHRMNDVGFYDGWVDYVILVRPTWEGISVIVKGPNRDRLREYVRDVFFQILSAPYERRG